MLFSRNEETFREHLYVNYPRLQKICIKSERLFYQFAKKKTTANSHIPPPSLPPSTDAFVARLGRWHPPDSKATACTLLQLIGSFHAVIQAFSIKRLAFHIQICSICVPLSCVRQVVGILALIIFFLVFAPICFSVNDP